MPNYDAVIGIDEPALNEVIRSVYDATHDLLLTGSLPITLPALSVTRIDYDLAGPPVVSLAPSADVRDWHRALLDQLAAGGADQAAATASRASFELVVPRVDLTFHYGDGEPTRFEASLHAGLQMIVESGGVLTPDLVTARVDVPGNPALTQIVNRGVVPELTRLIEQTFLRPVRIPPLGLGTLQVAPPAVATGEGRLLATTALLPDQPEPAPLAGAWPERRAFVAVRAPLLNRLLDNAAAAYPVTGDWSTQIRLFPVDVTVSAEYTARFSAFSLDVIPGQNGRLRGSARIDVDLHLWAKPVGWAFDGTATAHPTVRVTASINAANEIVLKLDRIEAVTFDFAFNGVPGFLDNLLRVVVNALAPVITAAVEGQIAKVPPQPVSRIPDFRIPLDETTVVVTLQDVRISTLTTPDDKICLATTGGVTVRLEPHTVGRLSMHDN
ncbi:hypothetical protein AB0F81_32885 [Actinoplanes sp. NPDC024001]|uniref:hypothetical protein n=1 Tax=Actinoplanes sp. NPDC024001 TaxID=3154598 RepID=UPI0033E6F542